MRHLKPSLQVLHQIKKLLLVVTVSEKFNELHAVSVHLNRNNYDALFKGKESIIIC